jgi:hypothetical protein
MSGNIVFTIYEKVIVLIGRRETWSISYAVLYSLLRKHQHPRFPHLGHLTLVGIRCVYLQHTVYYLRRRLIHALFMSTRLCSGWCYILQNLKLQIESPRTASVTLSRMRRQSTRSRGRCHTPKEDIPCSLVQLSEFRTQLNKEIFEYSM